LPRPRRFRRALQAGKGRRPADTGLAQNIGVSNRRDLAFLIRPAVLLVFVGAVAFWDRRPAPRPESFHPEAVAEQPPARAISAERLREAGERCARKSAEEFRRAWGQDVRTDEWRETADYRSHYNAALDSCFYLLEVVRHTAVDGGAVLVREMLFDVNEGELYGEYTGPAAGGLPGAGLPRTCRVAGFYCASRREWQRLAGAFMESPAVESGTGGT
jgi:hypothetical protein